MGGSGDECVCEGGGCRLRGLTCICVEESCVRALSTSSCSESCCSDNCSSTWLLALLSSAASPRTVSSCDCSTSTYRGGWGRGVVACMGLASHPPTHLLLYPLEVGLLLH